MAVVECEENENDQVFSWGKGNVTEGKAKVEEQQRHESEHHEVSEDYLEKNRKG